MRTKPILFSTPMVEAILEGRKTKTRREITIKKKIEIESAGFTGFCSSANFSVRGMHENGQWGESLFKLPYRVGDIMWVRETFFDCRDYKEFPAFSECGDFCYKADPNVFIGEHKWKPSLFMPREAARIFLEITSIKIERLHSISEEDAIAEGIKKYGPFGEYQGSKHPKRDGYRAYKEATRAFQDLWTDINGPDSWKSNPWVFVYTFKRVDRPEGFIQWWKQESNSIGEIE